MTLSVGLGKKEVQNCEVNLKTMYVDCYMESK